MELGGVKRLIRSGDQRVAAGAVERECGRAEAGRDRAAVPGRVFNGDPAALRRPKRPSLIGLGQNHDKLFAAVTGDEIAVSHGVFQQPGHLLQDGIPGRMAERIVKLLEMVNVQEEQR